MPGVAAPPHEQEPDARRRGSAARASGVPWRDLLGGGARRGRSGSLAVPMRDAGRVTTGLNRITWAALAAVSAAVGVSAFTLPYGPTRNLVDMIDAFAITAVTLGLRMAAQRSPSRPLLTRMLPFASAAAAVACGWAALTQSGPPFVVLAAMVTGVAAYDFGLATACVITATGVVAVDSARLSYPIDAWDLLGVPLLMIFGLLLGRLILGYRVQAEQSAALLAKAEQVRLEQRRTAALDERNRIAREIHDVLAHSLGSLGVQIRPPAPCSRTGATSTRPLICSAGPSGPPPKASPRHAAPSRRCALIPRPWSAHSTSSAQIIAAATRSP